MLVEKVVVHLLSLFRFALQLSIALSNCTIIA